MSSSDHADELFLVLPRGPLKIIEGKASESDLPNPELDNDSDDNVDHGDIEQADQEDERLLGRSQKFRNAVPFSQKVKFALREFKANMRRSRSLFFPL